MAKTNCWDVKKCGREKGGPKVAELGECPAATFAGAGSGLNSGHAGGRVCWALAGTFCGGKVQGDFAQKQANCVVCDVYKLVRSEEGAAFKMLLPNQKA